MTLWTAGSPDEAIGSPDEAIGCAEAEAGEYCAALGETEYTGFAESFRMDGTPGEGAEVFSLMRESDLPSGAYVGKFYATGCERTG